MDLKKLTYNNIKEKLISNITVFTSISWLAYTYEIENPGKELPVYQFIDENSLPIFVGIPIRNDCLTLPSYAIQYCIDSRNDSVFNALVQSIYNSGINAVDLIDVQKETAFSLIDALNKSGFKIFTYDGITTFRANVNEYFDDKKLVKKNEYYFRRITKEFDSKFNIYCKNNPKFQDKLNETYTLIDHRQKSKGKISGITDKHRHLWLNIPEVFNPTVITIESQRELLASMFISFDSKGLYYWTGGIVTKSEYNKYSFGNAIIHKAFELCKEKNLEFFDFLWGREEYKIHFKGKAHCGIGIYATKSNYLYFRNYYKKKLLYKIKSKVDVLFRRLIPQHSFGRRFIRQIIRMLGSRSNDAN